MKNKLKLGKLVMTRGINDEIAINEEFSKEILRSLARYKSMDWGELCEEDKQMNDRAIDMGDDRIFARYDTSKGIVYIITEWDRSVTTILFSSEY